MYQLGVPQGQGDSSAPSTTDPLICGFCLVTTPNTRGKTVEQSIVTWMFAREFITNNRHPGEPQLTNKPCTNGHLREKHNCIMMRIDEDSSAYSESFKRVECTNWEYRRVRVTHHGRTDGRTDGHAVKRLLLVGWTNGPMYRSKEGISGFGRTDGQPENIMPPAPKGKGIKNNKFCWFKRIIYYKQSYQHPKLKTPHTSVWYIIRLKYKKRNS